MKNVLPLLLLVVLSCQALAQVPAYVPSNDLVAWYPFNGNAQNEANPGFLDGTVNSAVLTTDRNGVANAAYQMNGNDANITIDSAFFDISWPEFTISCWINSDTLNNPFNTNQAQCIINTVPHNGLALYFNWHTLGHYDMLAGSLSGLGSWDILNHKTSVAPSTIHEWKHLAFVKTGGNTYSLYINGELDTTYTSTVMASATLCKIILGKSDPSVIQEGFYGKIDDYGIWKRALTDCEIRKMHLATPYYYLTTQPADTTGYETDSASFHVSDTGSGLIYQWQIKAHGSTHFSDITASSNFFGVNTPRLVIYPGYFFGDDTFRCVVTGTDCVDTSESAILFYGESVANYNNQKIASIVPNPAHNDIVVTGITGNNWSYRILDLLGRQVQSGYSSSHISIAELPSGTYLLHVVDRDGARYRGTIVKY